MKIQISKQKLHKLLSTTAIVLAVCLLGVVIVISRRITPIPVISSTDCVPAFRDGGGPYYLPNSPFRERIVSDSNNGEKLVVEGFIFDTNCEQTVANATLDIWQASEQGEYDDEYYRGQVMTNSSGYYRFETVVPLGYGEGTAYRPPHIHFKVHFKGNEIVTSQMFFEDVRGRQGFTDEFIIDLNQAQDGWSGNYNIILPDFY